MFRHAARIFLMLTCVPLLVHCSTSLAVPESVRLDQKSLHSFDGDLLPYTKWLPKEEPELIVIGVHGISGAASDYRPLADHLLTSLPRTAVYAAETRGQGNDPVVARRGHIRKRSDWFRDLYSFTSLIREKHPNARIVWCGESMGSLIVLHAYAAAPDRTQLCDAMILSSPIVDIRGDFPLWKEKAAHILAAIFPTMRVSLETLSGKDDVNVTKESVHQEQAEQNSYHIERHTLRLLSTLGDMIRKSGEASQTIDIPLLLLHGGKDVFSDPKDVEAFAASLPNPEKTTRKFYPESFHLLFFDHESDRVIGDVSNWLKKQ
ncbi:MAG: alpha/beta fold hydrolase [Verrucomicrobiaceae bacterium]